MDDSNRQNGGNDDATKPLDLNPLMRLKDALEGAQMNTSKMLHRLERFEKRLSELDDKMRPIQNTTKHYTKAKENISLTLVEVGKTYEYFRIANEVKEVVHGGLTSETQEKYFEALTRLSSAKHFFDTHQDIKSSDTALANIEELLAVAVAGCISEFERMLTVSGKSIALTDGQYSIINPLTPDVARDIKAICTLFESNNNHTHFEVYQSTRIAKLKSELRAQEQEYSAQWTAAQQDGPYEKGTHPFKEFFLLSYWLLRSELQLWGNTLPSNVDSLHVFVSICEAIIGELSRVLTPLLVDDRSRYYANPVVKRSKLLLVRLDILDTFNDLYEEFRDLCRPDVRHESTASMSLMEMRQIVVNACANSAEYLSSDSISEGFTFVDMSRKFPSAAAAAGNVGGSGGNGLPTSSSIATSGGTAAGGGGGAPAGGSMLASGLSSDALLLNDSSACDLHPAAGNLMYCCSEMREYSNPYRRMRELMMNAYSSGQSSKKMGDFLPPVDVNSIPEDTEAFISEVLDNLFAALKDRAALFDDAYLEQKSAVKRTVSASNHNLFEAEDKAVEATVLKARRHLFMCNNLLSVLNHVRDMTGGDDATGPKKLFKDKKGHRLNNYSKKVEITLDEHQRLFCDVIVEALGLDDSDMAEFEGSYMKNKTAEQHRLLKLKFSTFNNGMDAFLAQQGDWRVSNAGLREKLSSLLVGRVMSGYQPFFAKYSVVKFSKKHMEEYLKYPPPQCERNLSGFFGRN